MIFNFIITIKFYYKIFNYEEKNRLINKWIKKSIKGGSWIERAPKKESKTIINKGVNELLNRQTIFIKILLDIISEKEVASTWRKTKINRFDAIKSSNHISGWNRLRQNHTNTSVHSRSRTSWERTWDSMHTTSQGCSYVSGQESQRVNGCLTGIISGIFNQIRRSDIQKNNVKIYDRRYASQISHDGSQTWKIFSCNIGRSPRKNT